MALLRRYVFMAIPRKEIMEIIMESYFYQEIDSPIGGLLLTSDGTNLTGLYLPKSMQATTPKHHVEKLGAIKSDNPKSVLGEAIRQLQAYFRGQLRKFDVPLASKGTTFQEQVWSALQNIPYGATASYQQIARQIGRPLATRAVGLANNRNPIAIVIPCHRVIGIKGDLVGFGGGLVMKQWLLDHEKN